KTSYVSTEFNAAFSCAHRLKRRCFCLSLSRRSRLRFRRHRCLSGLPNRLPSLRPERCHSSHCRNLRSDWLLLWCFPHPAFDSISGSDELAQPFEVGGRFPWLQSEFYAGLRQCLCVTIYACLLLRSWQWRIRVSRNFLDFDSGLFRRFVIDQRRCCCFAGCYW